MKTKVHIIQPRSSRRTTVVLIARKNQGCQHQSIPSNNNSLHLLWKDKIISHNNNSRAIAKKAQQSVLMVKIRKVASVSAQLSFRLHSNLSSLKKCLILILQKKVSHHLRILSSARIVQKSQNRRLSMDQLLKSRLMHRQRLEVDFFRESKCNDRNSRSWNAAWTKQAHSLPGESCPLKQHQTSSLHTCRAPQRGNITRQQSWLKKMRWEGMQLLTTRHHKPSVRNSHQWPDMDDMEVLQQEQPLKIKDHQFRMKELLS